MILIEKVLLLKNSSIFRNCNESDLLEIAAISYERQLDKNITLFSKGETGTCMFFIYKGIIQIHDEEHTLAELSENEIFGELSLLDAETRSANATTLTDCILLEIEQEPFYEIMATNTEVLKGIMSTVCRRLRDTDRKTMELVNALKE